MKTIINPLNRATATKVVLIFLFALPVAFVALLIFSVNPLGGISAPMISIFILIFPLLYLYFIFLDTQLLVFDDKIEAELWISAFFGWHRVKRFPMQDIFIQQIPQIGEYGFPYQQLILLDDDGKKNTIILVSRSYKELKGISKKAESSGIVRINDVSRKDKIILTVLNVIGVVILLMFGLFATFILFVWIQGLIFSA